MSFGSDHVTVLPSILPLPLALRTRPGKVTRTSKSVNVLADSMEVLPDPLEYLKVHSLLVSS